MTTAVAGEARDTGHCIVLQSIGTAGISVVNALKSVVNLPENVIAAKLFQAPSILFRNVNPDIAQQAVAAFRGAGLECDIRGSNEPFTPGDNEHEVALVIHDYSRMGSILQAVVELLGVSAVQARKMVCASPAVLMGNISAATADALRRRFEPLGATVDVSRPMQAQFDVFIGECSVLDRERVKQILQANSVEVLEAERGVAQPLIATGLGRETADKVWDQVTRGSYPVTLVNRDFQRFDLRLDAAQPSPEMTAFLVETAKMPARVVPKVLANLPVVTHPNIRFHTLCEHLTTIQALGGKASGHLLAFQTFSLAIDKVSDGDSSLRLLRAVAGLSKEEAMEALTKRNVPGPLSSTQAHWLQHELKQVGTSSRMVLR